MKKTCKVLVLVLLATFVFAQSPAPPLDDTRLTIHTLLREDIFAGFLTNDLERLGRAERNIQALLSKRPAEKADLLAWQAGAMIYRAVLAHEANRPAEFEQKYQQALALFDAAQQANANSGGRIAVTGGTYVIFADRLPKEYRAAAWAQAYDAYQTLWKQQGAAIERLPVHFRGEVMSGLVMSAQRTGRPEESAQYLDKLLAVMKETPYETAAKRWKENPKAQATTNISCLNCHEGGRLTARLAQLEKK